MVLVRRKGSLFLRLRMPETLFSKISLCADPASMASDPECVDSWLEKLVYTLDEMVYHFHTERVKLSFFLSFSLSSFCCCCCCLFVCVLLTVSCVPQAHLHVVGMLRFMPMTWTNRACPLLFILFFCLFLSLRPFQLYFMPQILPITLRALTLFFRS